jgi:hypothetical protein
VTLFGACLESPAAPSALPGAGESSGWSMADD